MSGAGGAETVFVIAQSLVALRRQEVDAWVDLDPHIG
jgi:hypothetical protein